MQNIKKDSLSSSALKQSYPQKKSSLSINGFLNDYLFKGTRKE
jgi:hypothetical protein